MEGFFVFMLQSTEVVKIELSLPRKCDGGLPPAGPVLGVTKVGAL